MSEIKEIDRICDNCQYQTKQADMVPCVTCNGCRMDNTEDNWQPSDLFKAESEVARLRGIIGRLECWNYPEICKVKKCQTCRAKDEANKGREGGR